MYKKKSEIIEQIQFYHAQVAKLYHDIYKKAETKEMKDIISDLYQLEKDREKYLEKHKNVARAMNCWLEFPCEKLSKQISDCLELNLGARSQVTMEDLLKIELHFDDCLIKLYNLLAAENALSESMANIFYYMLKKTRKEQEILANMFFNSKSGMQQSLTA